MQSRTQSAELTLLVSIFMEGLYPVLVVNGIASFSPIFFGAISSLFAATIIFFCARTQLLRGLSRTIFFHICIVSLCIVVLGHVLIFTASQFTTGINIGLLLRFELVTTLLVGVFLAKDKLRSVQIFGALCIGVGTFLIVYNGSFHLNKGDVLVLIATILFPFGNMSAKKVLQECTPLALLFWRYALGGFVLLCSTPVFEPQAFFTSWTVQMVVFFVLFSLMMMIVSKLCFYSALKQLQMTNVIFQIDASAAVLSLFFAYVFLAEIPTRYQWFGFGITLLGVYWLTKKPLVRTIAIDHV